jgi:hypothetical protein
MATPPRSARLLPDGTSLRNRLLTAIPLADYGRLRRHLRMNHVKTGETLQDHARPITDVHFPNGGVFSVTMSMRNGALAEVASTGEPPIHHAVRRLQCAA